MKKRILRILLCLVLLLAMLPISASAVTTVSQINLTLDYPEAGKLPPATATSNGSGYSVYSIDWYDLDEFRYLEHGEKIQADHQYQAIIWVQAKDGYELKAVNDYTPDILAYVNGYSCEVQKAYEYKAWAMVTITYVFDYVPANGWIRSVDLSVPAPVAGEKPIYYKISSTSYELNNVYFGDYTDPNMKNGIAWATTADGERLSPDTAVFAPNTAYTFHCLVFPKEGYRFTHDATVWINGDMANASLDYGTFLSVNYDFAATGAAHIHTPSDWRTTQVYHYKTCTTCGDMLEQEDHKGGAATCSEEGKCTVCGYAYLETNENHTPDTSKWIARVEMYHYHACKLCGAHCDIEDHRWSPKYHAIDASGHAYQCADCAGYDKIKPHTPGPEATDTTPQTCTVCGYIITPVKGHVHKLTKVAQVPATCTKEGNIEYYTCNGCSDRFADAEGKNKIPETMGVSVGALGHQTGDGWALNAEYHWFTCEICDAALDETKMLHEDTDADGKCDTCAYVIGSGEPSAETEPIQKTPTEKEPDGETVTGNNEESGLSKDNKKPTTGKKSKGMDGWLMAGLIALACFGAAITVAVIVLKKKKR